MPPKKKQNVNRTGIYYLADEHRKQHPAYSRMSIHDLILLLLPRWRSMTLVERKPYEDLAKQYKRTRMLNNEYAITPIIPSREEASFIEKNSNENKYLDEYFSNDLIDIFKRDLFFVTFQIFCRTDDEDGGDYYPAEIAIMKYSFFESIKQEYFTIIKPEKFPVGYTGTAIDLSRETHQIPPFDFIGANGDYQRIWQEVTRVIGDTVNHSSTKNPIIIFSNAFERDQTTYLLNWLVSKGTANEQATKPVFRVCSFEALVAAVLRRLGLGDFAHQSVREQLRRPVYTIQVKDRCVYHDSLAIQYCCRAMNHGFSLFLDDFVRQRFIQALPETTDKHVQKSVPSHNLIRPEKVRSIESTPSGIDSIASAFIEKQKGLRSLTQHERSGESEVVQLGAVGSNVFIQSLSSSSTPNLPTTVTQKMSILSIENKPSKSPKVRVPPSPIEVDCRWPVSSLYNNNNNDDDDQYIMTGRGLRQTIKYTSSRNSNQSENIVFVSNIGRGRRINSIPPVPGFPM